MPVAADGTTDLSALASLLADKRFAAVAVQNPNFFGAIDVPSDAARAAVDASGTVLIGVVAEALSLGALVPPREWGAAIVAGEAQSFGVPIAYGGPYVGFIAATTEHMRRIPGRLAGRTVDADGNPGYTLTLQAREQHIRREKATSNICTNQAHCALIATIYLAALGETGLRQCATLNVERTHALAERVTQVPRVHAPLRRAGLQRTRDARAAWDDGRRKCSLRCSECGILGGVDLGRWYPELADSILMTATEVTTDDEIEALGEALDEIVAERKEAAHV